MGYLVGFLFFNFFSFMGDDVLVGDEGDEREWDVLAELVWEARVKWGGFLGKEKPPHA